MERLWAPWRMEYIDKVNEPKECIFCVDNPSEEEMFERLILVVEDLYVIIMNKFPYNTGHLLIAPRRHVGDFLDLTEEEGKALFEGTRKSIEVLKKVMKPHGFNVGLNLGKVAGAGIVDHLHVHVVPRWNGDTNFMPVVGETKVMPQLLKELYPRLKEAFDKLRGK